MLAAAEVPPAGKSVPRGGPSVAHLPWTLVLAPLRSVASWSLVQFPVARPVVAGGAVLAGYLAGRMAGGVLAAIGRYLPLAAGVAVAVYVMRGS